MNFKEDLQQEKQELIQNKKPHETVAFILFALLFAQQFLILFYRIIEYIVDLIDPATNTTYFDCSSMTTPAFFQRIVLIDSKSILLILLALAALGLWYFLIFKLVFQYSQKHGMSKWTWTTLVMFGPNIVFVPAYMIYIAFVFRKPLIEFLRKIVKDVKGEEAKE